MLYWHIILLVCDGSRLIKWHVIVIGRTMIYINKIIYSFFIYEKTIFSWVRFKFMRQKIIKTKQKETYIVKQKCLFFSAQTLTLQAKIFFSHISYDYKRGHQTQYAV